MAIICDLDDTLADSRRRMPLWGNWDAFYDDAPNDPPIKPMVMMVRALSLITPVHIITARQEKFRRITIEWLLKYEVQAIAVHMRPDDNRQTSPELKLGIAEALWGPELRSVMMAIDDRDDVLAAFRARGVFTLQATYHDGKVGNLNGVE